MEEKGRFCENYTKSVLFLLINLLQLNLKYDSMNTYGKA